ncbi:MAG: alpha/beta fold hydrolase, partial [Trichodesmium erythraeum GBRTRLIN201]|nr:alpha/beta fold hydrolase [Trichodesmium erythraeum GBRTRLIN201]
MSLFRNIKKAASSVVPSPIQIDFEKGGGRKVQEVAPYPEEVFWDTSVAVHKTPAGIEFVRTPEERFKNLPGYDFEANYVEIDGLRMHYLDEGPKDGPVILMLHGQPVWSYLYRKMIKDLIPKGYRCIAPDMIGMGKSDKPIKEQYHIYDRHCENTLAFVKKLGLKNITAFVQ